MSGGITLDRRFRSRDSAAVKGLVHDLEQRVRAGQRVRLLCHCAPKRCHTEAIRDVILRRIGVHGGGQVAPTPPASSFMSAPAPAPTSAPAVMGAAAEAEGEGEGEGSGMVRLAAETLVDIGVNLTNRAFKKDAAEVVARAALAGVSPLMLTGTSVKASRESRDLSHRLCIETPAMMKQMQTGKISGPPELYFTSGVVSERGLDYLDGFKMFILHGPPALRDRQA